MRGIEWKPLARPVERLEVAGDWLVVESELELHAVPERSLRAAGRAVDVRELPGVRSLGEAPADWSVDRDTGVLGWCDDVDAGVAWVDGSRPSERFALDGLADDAVLTGACASGDGSSLLLEVSRPEDPDFEVMRPVLASRDGLAPSEAIASTRGFTFGWGESSGCFIIADPALGFVWRWDGRAAPATWFEPEAEAPAEISIDRGRLSLLFENGERPELCQLAWRGPCASVRLERGAFFALTPHPKTPVTLCLREQAGVAATLLGHHGRAVAAERLPTTIDVHSLAWSADGGRAYLGGDDALGFWEMTG